MSFLDDFKMQNFEDEGEFMPLMSMDEEDENKIDEEYDEILPVLALKNTVLFPGIVIPITVGRDKSIKAIQAAYDNDRIIAVLSQKEAKVEQPTAEDLFTVGTVARILKLIKMPDGTTTAIIQGRKRFESLQMVKMEP